MVCKINQAFVLHFGAYKQANSDDMVWLPPGFGGIIYKNTVERGIRKRVTCGEAF
jgi:hypothetical protein